MTGIYQLRNTENGKRYIGQSKNLSHRKSCHFYALKSNTHHNKELQEDYNRNPKSIVFEKICICNAEELDELEVFFIKKYDANNQGYNISPGGSIVAESTKEQISRRMVGNKSMQGIKLSDEWKKHISEAQPHRKRIKCIETDIIYDSFADCARKTGLNRTKIVSCCTGKRKATGGYHFIYVDKTTSD